ncbi:MAG: hypothetical protein IKY71_05640 [Bacteroidaceae bacterium]|nr:hypothetical protein [Bacteroidaceae bacterium]
MKKAFSLMLLLALIICLAACSNNNNLEIIFPLGTSIEDLVDKESITDEKYQPYFSSNEEITQKLSYYGTDLEKDDLEDVSSIEIEHFTKNGISYDYILLLFQNNKLIQVYANIEYEDDISLGIYNSKLKKFKRPKEIVIEQTYNNGKQTYKHNVLQYKSRNIYFETFKTSKKEYPDDEFTYYTKNIMPLYQQSYVIINE